MRFRLVLVLLFGPLVQNVASGQAPAYNVVDLGTLPEISVQAVNAHGQAAGFYQTAGISHPFYTAGATLHALDSVNGSALDIDDSGRLVGALGSGLAFLYDGSVHPLGTLGGATSAAWAINNSGQIVGVSDIATDEQRAFLYDGAMHDLGTLGGGFSIARDINSHGDVVGSSQNSSGVTRAFLYDGTTMHELGTLGGVHSHAYAVNESKWVTGTASAVGSSSSRPFLYDGVTMHDIGHFGGGEGVGFDINEEGHVVGQSDTATLSTHAFYYTLAGGMVDLNTLIDPSLGWTLHSARGINEAGQIAGTGTFNGQRHAFLLNPVPEPSGGVIAVAAILAGLCVQGAGPRRRK